MNPTTELDTHAYQFNEQRTNVAAPQSVVALIAYEDPRKSPLQHLLTPAHREQVADVVNLAVLGAAGLAASQDDTGAAVRETPDKVRALCVSQGHRAAPCCYGVKLRLCI